jgi:hypothetical protein
LPNAAAGAGRLLDGQKPKLSKLHLLYSPFNPRIEIAAHYLLQ